MSSKKLKAGNQTSRARELLTLAGGSVLVYVLLSLVVLFLLERQPASFIYVSF